MTLTLDLSAIRANAAIVGRCARTAGFEPVAVIKEAYALPPLLAAISEGGIGRFLASTVGAARVVRDQTRSPCGLLAITPPPFRPPPVEIVDATLHIRADTAQAAARIDGHQVWIEVLTSDGRKGAAADCALQILARCDGPGIRAGLLFNWGCLGEAPSLAEAQGALSLGRQASEALGHAVPISLGGSALLPLLPALASDDGGREFRAGEAILTGGVPGATASQFGLLAPLALEARIVDLRVGDIGGKRERLALIDCGHTLVEENEMGLEGFEAKVVGMASEMTLMALSSVDESPRLGQTVRIPLGYRSALRALSNRMCPLQLADIDHRVHRPD